MVEPVLEPKETAEADKETLHATAIPVTVVIGQGVVVSSSFVVPAGFREEEAASEDFTEDALEDALDRVSRPVKGKYAHIPYSSEDFIRDKRREAELEDR